MKSKVLTILFILISVTLFSGLAYSVFNSTANLKSSNQGIAKFIFNAELKEEIELPLIDLKPGIVKEYNFSVCNSDEQKISQVLIEYEIIIKTYHLIPLEIKLYKIVDNEEKEILDCNESSFSRDEDNYLVCKTQVQQLDHKFESIDDYKLEIGFLEEYNDEIYSELVDFINLKIKSWQKTKD